MGTTRYPFMTAQYKASSKLTIFKILRTHLGSCLRLTQDDPEQTIQETNVAEAFPRPRRSLWVIPLLLTLGVIPLSPE